MPYFTYQSKQIYYSEAGEGKPLLFLHGNTASSKMFEPLLPLYTDNFKVILIDFLGNGRSDRVEKFPVSLWQEWAKQTVALLEHLYGEKIVEEKVSIAGSSGGAWAAINAGLIRPDLVDRIVADSFDGRTLGEGFVENLLKERESAKKDEQAAGFYQWCQGEDWEQVVDKDTEALVQCGKQKLPLFVRPLSELQVPLMLIGSLGDEMTRENLQKEYEEIAVETRGQVCLFPEGGHPAMYSNAEEAAEAICRFLKEDCL